MTRAIDRLIVSGAVDPVGRREGQTSIRWLLERLAVDLDADGPVELERDGARVVVRIDRRQPEQGALAEHGDVEQLELFRPGNEGSGPAAPVLAELPAAPPPPAFRIRRLSYSALALFERCGYRFYAERIVGLRAHDGEGQARPDRENGTTEGLAATEIGDAVHVLLEHRVAAEDARARAAALRPAASDADLDRIEALVLAWHQSRIADRLAALDDVRAELPFAFEHDRVLLHGRLDLFRLVDGQALVVDYKTNRLDELTPAEVVDAEYELQRLVYALACFRAGADEVEVTYVFLERPQEVVTARFGRDDAPALEERLSAAIRAIQDGEFRPTPGELVCEGCPALDVVCAGPRLPSAAATATIGVQ